MKQMYLVKTHVKIRQILVIRLELGVRNSASGSNSASGGELVVRNSASGGNSLIHWQIFVSSNSMDVVFNWWFPRTNLFPVNSKESEIWTGNKTEKDNFNENSFFQSNNSQGDLFFKANNLCFQIKVQNDSCVIIFIEINNWQELFKDYLRSS
jgi:hypothetical protein